jgi:hypothetical protein
LAGGVAMSQSSGRVEQEILRAIVALCCKKQTFVYVFGITVGLTKSRYFDDLVEATKYSFCKISAIFPKPP